MSTTTQKSSLKDALTKAAIAGTYTAVANESVNAVRAGILLAMKDSNAEESAQLAAAKFLETEIGASLLSLVLGITLREVPMLNEQKFVPELSDKMLEASVARTESYLVQMGMKYIMPAVMNSLAGLSKLENLGERPQQRIAEAPAPKTLNIEYDVDCEEIENHISAVRKTVAA